MSNTEKKSLIVNSILSNEWQNPSGGITYYYDLTLANGDLGSIGVSQKDSPKIQKGAELTYTIFGGKIKAVTSTPPPSLQKSPTSTMKPRANTQESFLGYAWSYAKDFVVAGKTMKDVEELNNVARYIYNEIGKMLNREE